ncbi:MAG TPA: Ig-like domain-containing protein [Jatrophihabitans sp.]|nr:Ig-like domain-containing protein [Jatrophihabitans sp.]
MTGEPPQARAAAAGGLQLDKLVSGHATTKSTSVTSPAFTTSQAGELLVAFLESDGPGSAQTFSAVTGGGLTWRLRQRANTQRGTAEIWQATATGVLTNATVKGTHSGSYFASVTVATFIGANTAVDGATIAANAATGAPSATLSTTKPGSWVWGVGDDYDQATARTVGPNQTKVDEYLAASGDTFWVQRENAVTPTPTPVTINDTAPTTDRWNLAVIEIPAAVQDTAPPSVPTGLTANAVSPTRVDLSWVASTDDTAVTGYNVLRNGTQLGTATGTSYSDTTAAASTDYSYTVRAYDAAGNTSADSLPATVSTPTPDATPPAISVAAAGPVSQTSATVTWTTDEPASSQVNYGPTAGYGNSSALNPTLVLSHSQTITGLSASTTYHFQVSSTDAAGNNALSADKIFTTPDPAPDTTPPTVTVTAPANAATVSGSVNVTATASDDTGVVGVQFILDGANLGAEDTTSPYSIAWDTKTVGNGSHALSAIARDAAGNSATATTVNVTVSNDLTPPTVSLTTPPDGTTVSGTISVAANANDNVGVGSVQFLLDGANLGAADTTSPYSVNWDSTAALPGSHSLSAKATDTSGNTATAATVTITVDNGSSDPSAIGSWGPVVSWPEVSIHAALTNTGKILTFQGDFTQGGQQYLLDPTTGVQTQVPNAAADLFCAGQAVLPDGKIMVIGGTSTSGGLGIKTITAFNPATETWQTLADMHYPRWYPTGTTLGDGRVLVTSGADKTSADIVQIPEVYDTQRNTWSDLTAATHNIPIYPFIYQLPDGRVLWAGASEVATQTEVLSANLQSWSTVDARIIDGSSIVNYAPGKFMKAGSAADDGNTGNSVNTAFTLDMNLPGATWQPTGSMAFPRAFTNLTNLPDGTVLATGGGTDKTGFDESHAVKPAEVWDPATGIWKTVAALTAPRLYHSVAVLLPDGRVFVSGSGSDPGVPDEKNYQIYSPSYLFKGPRPTITSAPSTVQYDSNVFVQTPDAASIQKVTLIRTGSVTHAFDQNARALQLSFTQTAGGLNVHMPVNGNYAPPGYYLLSIVNGNGVPSVSSYVRFPAPFEDNVAPTAPTNLTATGGIGRVGLSWSAATDNIGVAKYDVYRSTTPGFTPSPANQVVQASGSTLSYSDTGLSAGTYYYQVKAEDAAANISPSSNEASATATTDTIPPTAPTNLVATVASGQVGLSWSAATDNVGVTRYNVLRDGTSVGTATGTSFTDSTVAAGNTYSYTVTAQDAAGNVSAPSNAASATVPSGVSVISVDGTATTHQATAATAISAPALTTTQSNELLLAFLSSDGPSSGSVSFSGVSGGGLTWTLRKRQNTQAGTAEIWQAVAPNPLSAVTFTATRASGSWQGSMTVVGFKNADTALGATAGASAASGAPIASLTTTRAGSWVWAVGTDWSAATARTVGASQSLVDQYLAPAGDTYWVQRQNSATAASGTLVTVNDTAPTGDRYDLALIEILAK